MRDAGEMERGRGEKGEGSRDEKVEKEDRGNGQEMRVFLRNNETGDGGENRSRRRGGDSHSRCSETRLALLINKIDSL